MTKPKFDPCPPKYLTSDQIKDRELKRLLKSIEDNKPKGGWPKLDPVFKEHWLEVLERPADDGGYLKGIRTLIEPAREGNHRFCCIGVAFNEMILLGKLGPTQDWNTRANNPSEDFVQPIRDQSYLPDRFGLKIGLTHAVQEALAKLNDRFKDWGPVIQFIKDEL